MPYCVGCGVRVEAGVQRCPACLERAAREQRCPRCGAPVGGSQSRFCVSCGAPLAATQAGPPPGPLPAAGVGQGSPTAAVADRAKPAALIEATKRERGAIYQRLGRQLIGACYEGKLPFERLPDDLARQVQGSILAIRKGHASLADAGICPRCLEPALSGDPRTCARCQLVIPKAPAGRA